MMTQKGCNSTVELHPLLYLRLSPHRGSPDRLLLLVEPARDGHRLGLYGGALRGDSRLGVYAVEGRIRTRGRGSHRHIDISVVGIGRCAETADGALFGQSGHHVELAGGGIEDGEAGGTRCQS